MLRPLYMSLKSHTWNGKSAAARLLRESRIPMRAQMLTGPPRDKDASSMYGHVDMNGCTSSKGGGNDAPLIENSSHCSKSGLKLVDRWLREGEADV